MNKINLLIIVSLFSLSIVAQEITLTSIVNIKIPEGAERLSREQIIDFVKGKHTYSQEDRKYSKGEFYKLNTMILQLNALQVNFSKEHLDELKFGLDGLRQMDGMYDANYTSEIKAINNYRVLVTHSDNQYSAYYNFISFNNFGASSVTGKLEYDKSDKSNREKAENILNAMLETMHFKKD